jgi:hypothetical protein
MEAKKLAPVLDLERRLEEARAKRAAAAAAREEAKLPARLQTELEREERAMADDEVIARLEDEHGAVGRAIGVVHTDLGAVVLKRAAPPQFKRFQDLMARENPKQHELSDTLVRPCVLHPSQGEFEKMLAEQPHILIRCANTISELAGVRTKEEAGK